MLPVRTRENNDSINLGPGLWARPSSDEGGCGFSVRYAIAASLRTAVRLQRGSSDGKRGIHFCRSINSSQFPSGSLMNAILDLEP